MIYTLTLNPALDLELQVEQFEFNSVSRAQRSQVDCGGKGFNVSRLLHSLGLTSTAMGFVGGHTGARLTEALQAQGIATDFTEISGETRTNVSIAVAGTSEHIKVNETGPTIHDDELEALFAQVKKNLNAGDWWVLAGSLPPGVPSSVYAQLTELIQQAGARVLLDTSGEALRLGCAAKPALIKPNIDEALELLGLEAGVANDPQTWVNDVLALGPERLVISLGKEGALFTEGDAIQTQATPSIAERNPTGAGDSLVAGLAYQLSQGASLATAVRFGAACGAATASRAGTLLGDPDHIRQLFAQLDSKPKSVVYAMPEA